MYILERENSIFNTRGAISRMDAGSFDLLRGLQNRQGGIRDVTNKKGKQHCAKRIENVYTLAACACAVTFSNISRILHRKLINY